MNIFLNGAAFCTDCTDLAVLAASRGLDPASLVIEHNRTVVRQEHWSGTLIREGDTIELLNFVGGG